MARPRYGSRGIKTQRDHEQAIILRIVETLCRHVSTPGTVALDLNDDGVPAPEGGLWTKKQIERVVAQNETLMDATLAQVEQERAVAREQERALVEKMHGDDSPPQDVEVSTNPFDPFNVEGRRVPVRVVKDLSRQERAFYKTARKLREEKRWEQPFVFFNPRDILHEGRSELL